MKQTFNIPSGCTSVTVEQVGNQIITSFEPEKYIPKTGDCVKIKSNIDDDYVVCVFYSTNERGNYCNLGDYVGSSKYVYQDNSETAFNEEFKIIEKLTPEEFQAEFAKLGYVYDFETHTASKIRWRANEGEQYFYVSSMFEVISDTEDFFSFDDNCYNTGNYFKTESEAKEAAEFLKQQLKQFINNKK